MQSFDQFCEQELLDEAGLKDAFVKKAKELSSNIMSKAKKVLSGLDFERKETMFMLETFFKKLKEVLKDKKTVTDEDVKRALKQLGDVGKLSLIAPLFMLPGGGTTTTVLYLTGKKYFNISILPQGLEQVFETVDNVEDALNEMQMIHENVMKDFDQWIEQAT